jgi:hypothetical protein
MKLFVRRALFLALLTAGLAAWGAKKKSHPSGSASPTPRRFDVPIPVDDAGSGIQPALVVEFPILDDRGRKMYYFKIGRAVRPDVDHIDMEKAFMQTFDAKGDPDIGVSMSKGVLDMNTRIVTSDEPVVISRSDFKIMGKKMVFDTAARKGELSGHVHMVIYNLQKSSAPAASPSPSAQPSPSPTSR